MKLSEYIEELTEHLEDCKSRGIDPVCYYAIDSEGNAYETVGFGPSAFYTKSLDHKIGRWSDIIQACNIDTDLPEDEKIEDYIEIVVIN